MVSLKQNAVSRRNFIKNTSAFCMALQLPAASFSLLNESVKIGIITDLHQDIMHDAPRRLQGFINHIKKDKPDAIVQLGDFAIPKPENKQVIEAFNNAHHKALHVLGNHDTDGGFTKEQCLAAWKMPAPYYAQQLKNIWLIVLDGNDKGSPTHKGGYAAYINPQQVNWLQQKLAEINEPAIIISHQPLAGPMAVDNAAEIQELLSRYQTKILLCINGHTHIDTLYKINGVQYVHINSASYFWMGEKYKHESYSPEILKTHPWIAYTAPYKDSIFATLTIDARKKKITIRGQKTQWVGKSPQELNFKGDYGLLAGKEIVPIVRDRKL